MFFCFVDIMFKYQKEEISSFLSQFIWEFKLGDNVAYNFKILFLLYKNKKDESEKNKKYYNKLIAIILVSIVEAILIDLLKRLDKATNDIPTCLQNEHINEIKNKLAKDKKLKEIKDSITGEAHKYYIMKKYDFNEIIKYCETYDLLFGNRKLYSCLKKFTWLRNRIHIENYYNNFERDESEVFSELRIDTIESATAFILRVMANKYSRNLSCSQKESNAKVWLANMN